MGAQWTFWTVSLAVLRCLLAASVRAPVPVPYAFDCAARRFAYEYGQKLIPRGGSFDSLLYALNLNDPECAPLHGLEAAEVPAALEPQALPSGSIYVDASTGADGNDGSPQAPLRSLQVAVDLAASSQRPVVLRSGVHYLDVPLNLGPEHSGITLMGHPGENAVVSGGKKVTTSWQPYKVRKGVNIWRTSLKGQSITGVPGLQLNGQRATRARYPDLPAGIEVSPGYGSMIPGGQASWTPPNFTRFGPVTYFTDKTMKHRRNDTADDWFQEYMIGIGGLCSVYDPPVGYWCSEHPSGGGAFAFRTPSGVAPKREVLPNAPYQDTSQMIVNVWRPARWANWMFEVAKYDKSSNNFTFGKGGNQGARGENTGGDFFVENVFEELDYPGEFFYNETTQELYLNYNGTGPPPSSMEVIVPQLSVLVNISGSMWKPVKNVTIQGITFKSTRYTYMEPHGVPSAGDWALDRIAAVFMQGTEGTSVQQCTFDRLDGNAVMLSGYNRYATIENSDFSYIGGNAMVAWGYTNETENTGFPYYTPTENHPQAGVDGTDGNHPRYTTITGNVAREVGLYEKQSSFFMQAKTAQTKISGNVFFNGPRAGINFNDGFGGADEVSHNLVFSTCRESGDHGPFNSWDRQPFLTTVRTGEPSMTMAWREIHHNYFIDNYSPQENVDNDDGSAYYRTHHNFMVYGRQGMKNDFGGHDNYHYGNIYAYAEQAMGVDRTLPGHEDLFTDNKAVLRASNIGSPECKSPMTTLARNSYFTPDGNFSVCGYNLHDAQQKLGLEINSTVAAIPSVETIIGWGCELLGMTTGRMCSQTSGISLFQV